MSGKIFLSYAHEDRVVVHDLFESLAEYGFQCWFDERELLPGMDWRHEIRHALQESDLCIVCFSASSVSKRGYVQKERKYALDLLEEFPEGDIFIIPVRLDKCELPDRFRDRQYVDLFAPNGKQQLLDGLRRLVEQKKILNKQTTNSMQTSRGTFHQGPLLNLNGHDWIQFEGQIEYYRENFSYKLMNLASNLIEKLKTLTASPDPAFYKTSQWQEVILATRNLSDYLPRSQETQLKPWVTANIANPIRNAAERNFQLQDWVASKVLYELVLSLGVDDLVVSTRLESIRENTKELEALKQKRYQLIQDSLQRDEHDQSIQSTLEWFMEVEPDYRDIRKIWAEFIRR